LKEYEINLKEMSFIIFENKKDFAAKTEIFRI